ncbi:hypothetical protein RB195_011206 [Necator americanus]|uniref:Endonuclease/exonuclease/phosphatase domain-containing protein n=1 Tax=Necator americanus TaxID=51031 RepID=A0ABR1D2L1_NECAM
MEKEYDRDLYKVCANARFGSPPSWQNVASWLPDVGRRPVVKAKLDQGDTRTTRHGDCLRLSPDKSELDPFHEELKEVIRNAKSFHRFVAGDFNAKLGKATEEEYGIGRFITVDMGIAQWRNSCGDQPRTHQPEVVLEDSLSQGVWHIEKDPNVD